MDKNIRFSVSYSETSKIFLGVLVCIAPDDSGFLLNSAWTGAVMSERNFKNSGPSVSPSTTRRLRFVGVLIVAICAGLFVWQLWPTLFAPLAKSPEPGHGQLDESAQRQGAERVVRTNGLENAAPSATLVPAQLGQSNKRVDGSAGRLELDPPSAISVDPDCLTGETQQSGSASPIKNVITAQEMVSQVAARLEANQEFPMQAHVVRWEMAFGLPGPGVLFWAEWSGENPARYSIRVQDARTPQSEWDAAGKAPIQQREKGLAWEDAVKVLKEIKYPLVQSFGPASYRRLIVTDAVPIDPDEAKVSNSETAPQLSAEVLGPRILYFSRPGLSCSRADGSAMRCSCAAPHVHR